MSRKYFSKHIICFLIITLLTGCLSSCGNGVDKKVDNNKINIQNDINLSSDGQIDDDSQSYFDAGNHNVAKGENGYYFLGSGSKNIMYFDNESLTSFPLCGKADCKHDDFTCNSYLGNATHIPFTIYYYKGYVYIIEINEGNAVLERVNADGSARQELGCLCSNNDGNSIGLVFHGDSIYVFDCGHEAYSDTEYTEVIRKFSLDGKSQGNIFEYKGTNITILTGKSYGNKLFFETRKITKDENNNLVGSNLGLFAYDYETNETVKVMESNISDYSIDVKNNIIYSFVQGDGLYKYNITTTENIKIFNADEETGSCKLSYDGRYIYMDNIYWCRTQKATLKKKLPQKCWVIGPDGSIINAINCDAVLVLYYGDQDFLFAQKMNGSTPESLAYISKNDTGNSKDWISLGSTIQ